MVATSTMIIASLVAIGDKSIGATLSSAEGTHYLSKFNAFLESMANDMLVIPYITTDNFALVANTSTYTIGTGATINTSRPTKLLNVTVRLSDDTDMPIEIMGNDAFWQIANKTQTGNWPEVVYYDQGFSATSTGTLHFAPVPTEANTVFLNSLKPFTNSADLSTNVSLPPGYQRFIESNFAIECSPGLIDPSASLMRIARESKAAIKANNLPIAPNMRLDTGIVMSHRRSSILDG